MLQILLKSLPRLTSFKDFKNASHIKTYDYMIEGTFPRKIIHTAYTRVRRNALKILLLEFPPFLIPCYFLHLG